MRTIFKLILIAIVLFSHFSYGQAIFNITDQAITSYAYNWGDEFENKQLDLSKWSTRFPWSDHLFCGPDINIYTTNNTIKLDSGNLYLNAQYAPIKSRAIPYESDTFQLVCNGQSKGANLRDYEYQSGMIFSKELLKYGYFEINFKTSTPAGSWPAFWLFSPVDAQEIDAFEITGLSNSNFNVDVHCKNGCDNYPYIGPFKKGWGANVKTSCNWNKEFNKIGIIWDSTQVLWYLNGINIAKWKGIFKDPMWIIANMGVTSDNGSYAGKPIINNFYPELTIDYIRHYNLVTDTIFVGKEQYNFNFPTKSTTINSKKWPVVKRKYLNKNSALLYIGKNNDKKYILQLYGKINGDVKVTFESQNKIHHLSDTIKINNSKIIALPEDIYTITINSQYQSKKFILSLK